LISEANFYNNDYQSETLILTGKVFSYAHVFFFNF